MEIEKIARSILLRVLHASKVYAMSTLKAGFHLFEFGRATRAIARKQSLEWFPLL